jgi:DNA-binding GntR family transcriptional regulator
VSEIDITDIEEIYELRIILEVQAARQAAAGMTKNELANTSEILLNAKALTAEGRRAEAIEHDHQFHSMVMKACQNFLLSEIGARILDRVIMIQNLNILTSDRLTIANAHHDEIFNAIAERDGDKAASLMSDHLVSAKEFVIQRLRSEQDILPRLLSTISSVTRRRQRN